MNKKFNAIHLLPIILLFIGVGATFFASKIAENFMDLFGLLLVVAMASLLLGALLGFLFGIPRSNNQLQRNQNEHGSHSKRITNLEEISNWLSIMLVGLILTQASKFPFFFDSIANTILANNDCIYNCQFARAIIIGEILFSSIAGFIIAYAYTRLYYANLFSIFNENEQQSAEIKIWKEGFNKVSEDNLKNAVRNSEAEHFKNKSKLTSFLTEDEISILTMITEQKNQFVVREPLTYAEHAAVNVLVEKGIISEIEGGNFRTGATLSITDKSLLEALK